MGTRGIGEFRARWDQGRAEGSPQGNKVNYGEWEHALEAVKRKDGSVSAFTGKAVASVISGDPVMTKPGAKAAREFLATVASGNNYGTAAVEAMKADFSLRAVAPFQQLAVPGYQVKNTDALPAGIKKAVADTSDEASGGTWDTVEVRKTALAGREAFIVFYGDLDGESDYSKVRVFSPEGKKLAEGSIDDPMAGFYWS